jgi:hypothetical protein
MSSDKYPSPKNNENFKKYWDSFINDIEKRENLKPSHLQQLKILCDLYVDYDETVELIAINGRTYESYGRNGTQIKLRPEVALLKSTVSEIRNYSRMLGLLLHKDTSTTNTDETVNDFD